MQPPPKKSAARVDTLELKAQIVKRLGPQRAELYFRSLRRFLGCQLGKDEFDKICVAAFGKENIKLHNFLIRSILGNATVSDGPPPPPSKQAPTGNSQTSTVSNGTLTNGLLLARRGRPLTRRSGDKPSPIGKSPLGPGAGEFVSGGSKALQEVISVEDGEEVDQARGSPVCVQSQSPIRPPLGAVPKAQNSQPSTSFSLDVCYNNGVLPDSQSLSKLLEEKLKDRGLSVPKECADVLNSGLNVYIGQMLRACLGVAKARGIKARMRQPNGHSAAAVSNNFPLESGFSYQASLHDLWAAVQSNGRLVGCGPQREKLTSHLLNR